MHSVSAITGRFASELEGFLHMYAQSDLRKFPRLRRLMFRALRVNPEWLFAPLPIPASSEFTGQNLDFKVIDWLCARGDSFLVRLSISVLKKQGRVLTDVVDRFENTPLTWAVVSDTSAEFLAMLLKNGANPLKPNKAGTLPLHDVVQFSGQSVQVQRKIALLVEWCGPDVLLMQNWYGSTPAARAVYRGQIEVVQALCRQAALYGVEYRQMFRAPNRMGYTPYDLLNWRMLTQGENLRDKALQVFLVNNGCAFEGEVWAGQTEEQRKAYQPTEQGIYRATPELLAVYAAMNHGAI